MSGPRLVSYVLRRRPTALLPFSKPAIVSIRRAVRCYSLFRPSKPLFKQPNVNWSAAISHDLEDLGVVWHSETQRDIQKAGLNKDAVMYMQLLARAELEVNSRTSVGKFHELLQNYVKWKSNPQSLPAALHNPKSHVGLGRTKIEELSEAKIGEMFTILGKQYLRVASRYNMIEVAPLNLAIFFLELAVRYNSTDAAVLLINTSEDPAVMALNKALNLASNQPVRSNVGGARSLISDVVFRTPEECDWQTMVTCIRHECRESNIVAQRPSDLGHMIDTLVDIARDLDPDSETPKIRSTAALPDQPYEQNSHKYLSWLSCENPWRLLRRIVVHCLQRNLSLPGFSKPELEDLQDECMLELVRYNDPNACFTYALRACTYGTPEWENMIKCAAAAGIADANWLLGSHYREQRLLSDPTKKRFDDVLMRKLIFEHAKQAILLDLAQFAAVDKPLVKGKAILLRILALASYCKECVSFESGRENLRSLVDPERVPFTPPQLRQKVQQFLNDYEKRNEGDERWTWHSETCWRRIEDAFDIEQALAQAERSQDCWHVASTG